MSITVGLPTYFGQPLAAPAGGQIFSNNGPGPLGRTLMGQAKLTLDGTASTGTIVFIDGTQTFGKTIILQLQQATAAATIGGVANQTQYYSTNADGQVKVGDSVVVAGFTNSGNNGTFTVTAVTSSYVQVTNSGGVAEINPAGTLSDVQNGTPVAVYATLSTESSGAYLGIEPNVISSTGWSFVLSGAGTSAHTVLVNFIYVFPGI